MSRILNSYAYMYAFYTMIYICFLYDWLQISPLRVLVLSLGIILETLYVFKYINEKNKQTLIFFISTLLACLLSYQGSSLFLVMYPYYLVIQVLSYFFIRDDKEIENKHLFIPLVVGFSTSMYFYEFNDHYLSIYLFTYIIVALSALASSNLDVYYMHRHNSKEKTVLEYILGSVVIIVSLFSNWILTLFEDILKLLLRLILTVFQIVFSTVIEVVGYAIGSVMAMLFKDFSMPEIKLEMGENALGELTPGQTQNPDFLKPILQLALIFLVIFVLSYIYKKYKEEKRVRMNRKEVKAYYQEIEDLERNKSSVLTRFKRESLSKIRKKYKKEVKKKIRLGFNYLSHYTPKEYLKTLPDTSMEELTLLYQQDRYGGKDEERS